MDMNPLMSLFGGRDEHKYRQAPGWNPGGRSPIFGMNPTASNHGAWSGPAMKNVGQGTPPMGWQGGHIKPDTGFSGNPPYGRGNEGIVQPPTLPPYNINGGVAGYHPPGKPVVPPMGWQGGQTLPDSGFSVPQPPYVRGNEDLPPPPITGGLPGIGAPGSVPGTSIDQLDPYQPLPPGSVPMPRGGLNGLAGGPQVGGGLPPFNPGTPLPPPPASWGPRGMGGPEPGGNPTFIDGILGRGSVQPGNPGPQPGKRKNTGATPIPMRPSAGGGTGPRTPMGPSASGFGGVPRVRY